MATNPGDLAAVFERAAGIVMERGFIEVYGWRSTGAVDLGRAIRLAEIELAYTADPGPAEVFAEHFGKPPSAASMGLATEGAISLLWWYRDNIDNVLSALAEVQESRKRKKASA